MKKIIALAALAVAIALLLLPVLAFAQSAPSTPEDWFAAVCGQQDLVVAVVKYVLAPIGGAAVLANLRGYLPAPLVAVLDFLGANWASLLKAAMDGTKKATPALLLLLALGLAACASTDKAVQFVAENMDDACFYAGTAEGLYEKASAGRVDAAGQLAYAAAKAEIDGLCSKPYPTDTRQAVAKLAVLTANLAVALVPAPALAAQ